MIKNYVYLHQRKKVISMASKSKLQQVKDDPNAITSMISPPENAQVEAVSYDWRLIEFIDEPTQRAKEVAHAGFLQFLSDLK